MISQERIDAARANGALSSGPSTPGPNAVSAHDLPACDRLAAYVVLPSESRQAFDDMFASCVARFLPRDPVEMVLVEEMVVCGWRVRRGRATKSRLVDVALQNQPPGNEHRRLDLAFAEVAALPKVQELRRTEAQFHRTEKLVVRTLELLRQCPLPNEANKSFIYNCLEKQRSQLSQPATEPR
jgi:hypothetical protein